MRAVTKPNLKPPADNSSLSRCIRKPWTKPSALHGWTLLALQVSWTPGPLFRRGRDVFPKTLLTFEESTISSSSARLKQNNFLQWRPFQRGRKGLCMGTQEEEITTLRCESHPTVESYWFPEAYSNIHYQNPGKWCNWWLQPKQLAFLNAYHPSFFPFLPFHPIPPSFSSSITLSIFQPFSTALHVHGTECHERTWSSTISELCWIQSI